MCKRALVRHLLWTWWVLCSTNNNNNNNTNEKQSILYWTETKPKWRKKSEKKKPAKPIPLMVKMVLNSLSMHLALDCVSVFCCCCCFFFFIIIFFVCYLFFVPCIFFVSSFLLSSHFNAPYSMLDAPHWARAVCCFVFLQRNVCSLYALCVLFAYYVMVGFQLFALTIHLSSAKMFQCDESFIFVSVIFFSAVVVAVVVFASM